MALLTQRDIHAHYQQTWAEEKKRSDAGSPSLYASAPEDALVQPIYREMLRDLHIPVGDGNGEALDIGCGAGRWVRFLEERVKPRRILGVDVTEQSVELLRSRHRSSPAMSIEFRAADIADPALDLGTFDLVNIANVLFHIPEHDLYWKALVNLRKLVKPGGCVITTEYLPRADMRTNWMLVRSRYNFEMLVKKAGFRIASIRAFTVFNNDPMGLDGPDDGTRALFYKVRQQFSTIMKAVGDANGRAFFEELQADVDRAFLAFCKERIADIDLPSQKLVALIPV